MSKLPRLSGKETVRLLSKAGFSPSRQKGSHLILVKVTPNRKMAVVVPLHQELDTGTLLEIIRQSGMTKEEFLALR